MKNTSEKPHKQPLTKQALWIAIVYGIVFFIFLGRFLIKQFATPEFYIATPAFLPWLFIIIFLGIGAYSLYVNSNAEKEDELATFNKYQAGYVSFYITMILAVIISILIMEGKITLTADTVKDINLPLMLWAFLKFMENIIFVIIEKLSSLE